MASLFCAASLASCENTITRQATARVLDLSGTVFITPAEPGATKSNMDSGAHPKAGDIIETGENGRAAFSLLPGALILLEPDSTVLIEEIKLGKNGFASAEAMQRTIRIRLLHGILHAVVQWESEPAAWAVSTTHGRVVTGFGGVCRIEALNSQIRVISVRGDFTFVPTDGPKAIHLESGFAQEWPSPQAAFPAELDRGTLPEIQAAREVERKLLELQMRLVFSPYPWR